MPRIILTLLVVVALSLVVNGCGEKKTTAQKTAERPVKKARVELVKVVATNLQETFVLPGRLEAWESLTLAAELAGPVRWIGPAEGDYLTVDEAILRIDTDTLKANLQRDQTGFEVQQKEFNRYQQLLAEQLVSQQEFGVVRSALEAARANLRQSQLALDKSLLKSPINGILDRLLVDRGEYVSPGDPLAEIVQIDKLKVIVDVPEKDVAYLAPGQKVEVISASLGDDTTDFLAGKILHVGYQADPASRTFRVKVEVGNPAKKLRPGMILRVRFLRKKHVGVLAVPLFAVVDRDGQKYLFVSDHQQARQKLVRLGAVVGDRVIVEAGLKPGEQLVVKGQQLLTDGAQIQQQEDR